MDPLGLSYDADDPQTIDPRDQLNPGLVRITNGEDLLTDFTGISDDRQEIIYRNTMLDPRWSKFMLQRGFKRTAVPLYWTVGQLHQDPYPGAHQNVPTMLNTEWPDVPKITGTSSNHYLWPDSQVDDERAPRMIVEMDNSDPRGFFQTGHRGRMGWMPTDAFSSFPGHSSSKVIDEIIHRQTPMYQPIPAVNVITAILPKAYKTVYYYRLYITETVYLSGLKNTGIEDSELQEFRAVDNFLAVGTPYPCAPDYPFPIQDYGTPHNDGGGKPN